MMMAAAPFWVVFGPGGHVVLPICHSFEQASELVKSEIVNDPPAAPTMGGLK